MTTKKLLAAAAAVIVIIFMVALIRYIGVQQEAINNLQGQISQLQSVLTNTIYSELDNVKNELVEAMNEQNRNAYNVSYTTSKYDSSSMTAQTTVKFSLKEYTKGDPVKVNYSDGTTSASVDATENNAIFSAVFPVRIDRPNYTVSYSAGQSAIRSEQLLQIDPYNDLQQRFGKNGYSVSSRYSSGKNIFDISYNVLNNFNNDEKLKLTSCVMKIYNGATLLKTVDLMPHMTVGDGWQCYQDKTPITTVEIAENTAVQDLRCDVTGVDGYGFTYDLS